MRLLWTKAPTLLSKMIRCVCDEDCSHFSFVFDSKAAGLMFESNLLGTHPAFLQTSLKTHTIVHEIDIPLDAEVEDIIWDKIVQKYDGAGYDYLGAFYLGGAKLLNRFLKMSMPLKNKWCQPGKYFCDEIYEILNGVPGIPLIDVMSGMDSPHDVFLKVSK